MDLLQKLLGRTRPAPEPVDEGIERACRGFDVGAVTDKGRVRERNEDALLTLHAVVSQNEDLLPLSAYMVADGMGGQKGGKEASDIAVRLVAERLLEHIYQPFLTEEGGHAGQQPISDVLIEAIVLANGKVHLACPNGGTTLTCALVMGTNVFLAHVGDCRAYLINGDSIRQITKDHSLVSRLVELGQITPQEVKTHPQRNVLYRALGRPGILEVDTSFHNLPDSSSLLMCSDGLWSQLSESEMLSIISLAPSPQTACRRLVERANEHGGDDNITALLVKA